MNDQRIPIFMVGSTDTHLPLAFGMIQAYAQRYGDGRLNERYRFLPILTCTIENVVRIAHAFGPGVWLLSDYTWNIDHA